MQTILSLTLKNETVFPMDVKSLYTNVAPVMEAIELACEEKIALKKRNPTPMYASRVKSVRRTSRDQDHT